MPRAPRFKRNREENAEHRPVERSIQYWCLGASPSGDRALGEPEPQMRLGRTASIAGARDDVSDLNNQASGSSQKRRSCQVIFIGSSVIDQCVVVLAGQARSARGVPQHLFAAGSRSAIVICFGQSPAAL